MEDLRKMLAAVNSESPAVKRRKSYESKPWALKYLGRKLSVACLAKYKDGAEKGFTCVLPWKGQERRISYNCYDDSTFIHELEVRVYADGPAAGRISDVNAYHWDHWHTSSNWQDHSESHSTNVRVPNDEEIKTYERILDAWTVGGSSEQVASLVEAARHVVAGGNRQWCVTYTGLDGDLSLRHDGPEVFSMSIRTRELMEALDVSHVYPEVLLSASERVARVGPKQEFCTLDYFLTLFKFVDFPELYPDADGLLGGWLYDVFVSCARYRDFVGKDPSVWWRDAWWIVQGEIADSRRKGDCDRTFEVVRGVNRNADIGNPLITWAGRLALPYVMRGVEFSVDDGLSLSYQTSQGRKFPPFKNTVVNGVEWAYCVCHSYVVIDLNASDVVDCEDGRVVFPERIEGLPIGEIRAIGEPKPKDWRTVVIPTAADRKGSEWGMLTIGKGAFRGWSDLTTVGVAPLVRIEGHAFENCSMLQEVVFLTSVDLSSPCIFQGCGVLSTVKCDANSGMWGAVIGMRCFYGCAKLSKLELTCRDRISLGERAFEGCTDLSSLTIVDMRETGDDRKLPSEKPSEIGARCFFGCAALSAISLPASVKIICDDAFAGCQSLPFIQLEGDGLWFKGANCFGKSEPLFWGGECHYRHEKIVLLKDLLAKLGISREAFMKSFENHPDASFSARIDVLSGRCRHYPRPRDFDDDYID